MFEYMTLYFFKQEWHNGLQGSEIIDINELGKLGWEMVGIASGGSLDCTPKGETLESGLRVYFAHEIYSVVIGVMKRRIES